MKRKTITHVSRLLCVLALTMTMTTAAFAADPPEPAQPSPCYPTAVTRSEDGGEIRKMYDLGPEDDPAGILRSDFEQEGYVSMWMYESEASELIWQLLYACIGAYEVEKEYSAELKDGGEGDTR